jgi:CRISPR-associated endonuclease/helicase Cas3
MDERLATLTLTDLWAKTAPETGEPALSVLSHCRNVGAVLEEMVKRLPEPLRPLVPAGFVTLGAGHDVGKITLGFQQKSEAWRDAHGLNWIDSEGNHCLVSAADLWQRGFRCPGRLTLAQVVRAHHGRYGLPTENLAKERCTPWASGLRRQLWDTLVEDFGPLPADEKLNDAQFFFLTGLLIVADWLGSNEEFFPLHREYAIDESRARAAAALAAIGWPGGSVRTDRSFGLLFPPDANGQPLEANPLQKLVARVIQSPGLHIIEAPMGLGKTEAALLAAHGLNAAAHHSGLYFGLPTQLTSNRIHERVLEHLALALERASTTNVPLAHGNAWLHDRTRFLIHPADDENEGVEHATSARFWFNGSRRPLLARYGVGTLDQALMGGIAVRYHAVRLFGLAGKVVIIDEVHSYDVYTGTLLRRMIPMLLKLRCTVILLSATLTRAQRQALLGGAGATTFEAPETAAELMVTTCRADAPTVARTVAGSSGRKPRRVRVIQRSEPWPQLVREAIKRAIGGDCALLIRNTVREAQETYRTLSELARGKGVPIGLLHSRFPQALRERQEDEWMRRLGKGDAHRPPGCVLVATQVVEQSVDIDADLLISELAPTDMLLQRLGRLWRHKRTRKAAEAEFWLWVPELPQGANAAGLRAALGPSARVYAPYTLLRSYRVWQTRKAILLPGDIHPLLEETYQKLDGLPDGWRELADELRADRATLENLAGSATRILATVPEEDNEQTAATRWSRMPTATLVLARAEPQRADSGLWRIEPLDGPAIEVTEADDWRYPVAVALHRNAVRVPRYAVEAALDQAPGWVSGYFPGGAALGVVGLDRGAISLVGNPGNGPALRFSPELGVEIATRQQVEEGWW